MQTLFNGVEVFTNSDNYNLADDVAHALETANLIIKVPSQEVRDAIPDPYAGMAVVRLDLPGCPIEVYDGTKWPISNVAWTNLALVQGFTAITTSGWSGLKYAVKDGWVIVDGAVARATSWGADQTCAVIPSTLKPLVKIQGTGGALIEPTVGNITLAAGSGAASFSLTWPLF